MDRAPENPGREDPAPSQPARDATSFEHLEELTRPGEVEPGWDDVEETTSESAFEMDYQGFTDCRLLIVSPKADGTSNADNVKMDATTDSTSPCTCHKPTLEQVLSGNFEGPRGLKFVAQNGVAIAREFHKKDPEWYCGVKLLHNSTGDFHAAWIGNFMEDNSADGHEAIIRSEVWGRGLNKHARMFRAANFPGDKEAWDYVAETVSAIDDADY